MDIAVGSLGMIVKLAVQIKDAVDTVERNKEVCQQITKRVNRLTGMLSTLENTEAMEHPGMIESLEDLKETMCRALELVTACKVKRSFFCFFKAKDISIELRQVNQDIMDQMGIANFGVGLNTNNHVVNTQHYIKDGVHHQLFQQDGVHLLPPSTRSQGNSNVSEREKDNLGFTMFSLSEMMTLTNNFSKEHEIGSGGYATVYKAVLPCGRVVAIKKFRDARLDNFMEKAAVHYVHIFSVLHEHENIVKPLGYCQERRCQIILHEVMYGAAETCYVLVVEEYMSNGSLETNGLSLDWSNVFRIVGGIARGVAYLHTRGVLHLDLKPANILLDSNMNPKICDFDIAQIVNQELEVTKTEDIAGTPGYLPPEYIGDGIISFKHDVFAFGVLLLKTLSRSVLQQDSFQWDDKDVSELLDPSLPHRYEVKRCWKIGLLCTSSERSDRPTMAGVVKMLDGKEQLPILKRNANASFKKNRD